MSCFMLTNHESNTVQIARGKKTLYNELVFDAAVQKTDNYSAFKMCLKHTSENTGQGVIIVLTCVRLEPEVPSSTA